MTTLPIDISMPQAAGRRGRHRVTALVDGRRIWFESTAAPLAAAGEAFAAALLVPALHAGRPLRLMGPACAEWTANLQRLTDDHRAAWYPGSPRPLVVPEAAAVGPHTATTALAFSGGINAFFALLHSGHEIESLVHLAGHGIGPHKRHRNRPGGMVVARVAAETGRRGVVIDTNLGRHPLFKATPWQRGRGGALAAFGHLLGPGPLRLLVAGEAEGADPGRERSRPGTDSLHGSARLAVEHVHGALTRLEKLTLIAGEPLVQRHLRVCPHPRGDGLNCGRCPTCVDTMIALDVCGMLGKFAGFAHGKELAHAIDARKREDERIESPRCHADAGGLSAGTAARPALRLFPGRRPTAGRPAARHRLLGPAAFSRVCGPLVGLRVGYVRPEGNVGDRLIEVGMMHLFAEYGIRWRLVAPAVAGDAEGLDILVFGGGGNMGTRYPGNHALRTQALATGLPVVILPQSFTNPEDRPFARVFVRERGSLALRPDGVLAPDLALGLEVGEPGRPDRELGIYLRRDQERGGRKPMFARDPVRLFRDPFPYLAFAARHRRIVTDRLHFAVAGLHAGREVTLVANDYHKNRSMHETWLADLGCRFAATLTEALGRRAA